MDFWTRLYSARNPREPRERFDGWRGAIMCGKFAPRIAGWSNFSRMVRERISIETICESKSSGPSTPFFSFPFSSSVFCPGRVSVLRQINRTIYFRRVKTSDWWRHDANSTMWEPIVTRSHRRGITKSRTRTISIVRYGIVKKRKTRSARVKLLGILSEKF